MKLNAYLFFDGRCEEAFKFYEKVFGARIEMMLPHAGTPAESALPAEWGQKIMHARMNIQGNLLMGSDAPPGRGAKPQGFSVNIGVETPEEAERIFAALSENAHVGMPIAETFWAKRFGMLVDQFGTPWMVNCEK
jgi:PhnB protein